MEKYKIETEKNADKKGNANFSSISKIYLTQTCVLLIYFLSYAGCITVVSGTGWENNLVIIFKLHIHQKGSGSLCQSEHSKKKRSKIISYIIFLLL